MALSKDKRRCQRAILILPSLCRTLTKMWRVKSRKPIVNRKSFKETPSWTTVRILFSEAGTKWKSIVSLKTEAISKFLKLF